MAGYALRDDSKKYKQGRECGCGGRDDCSLSGDERWAPLAE